MWYVVQTKSDNEELVMEYFRNTADQSCFNNLFVPMFEDVRKKKGYATIHLRRLFPGYFFVDTDNPRAVFTELKAVPEFKKILGAVEDDGTKMFLPIEKEDQLFLDSLMENGLMRVSLVKRASNCNPQRIIGPLAKYSNRIIKFDISRRRAIVQANIFGKERKLKFGLWTEKDPPLPWITESQNAHKATGEDNLLKGDTDIGIYPGDKVVDETGVYEEQVFTVTDVDPARRIVYTTIEMFGTQVKVQFQADDVRKI
ncbi:transcription termination/antitermination NusG family protein [Butyrivibrio sp. AE3004]|uniref:transcription termination/antitermination NusG family protein n=1 Tax=Butyrivibrio sp. AE3004 TaxID=1506994 RepID=UPI0004943053|nr:transcription termination/antitermination NusG family protein [Butyrivibrio sp. AE3004]